MSAVSMLNGIFSLLGDFLTGIFAFIPQMMYFIYTCAASILDFLQYVVRKLAGLDVYYVDGVAVEGDLVLNIIKGILGIENAGGAEYSVLSTVFWSLVIFAVIVLVLATIIKLVVAHYNYDAEKSNPFTIIRSSVKSILTMAIIPIVTIFGIQISNALLSTLDQISSGSSNTTIATVFQNSPNNYENVFKAGEDSWGRKTYSSYDFFSFGSYTNMSSVSGQLFHVAAHECNRVRKGSFTAKPGGVQDGWSDFGIFTSKTDDGAARTEEVAYMIDFAFANNLTLKNRGTASVLMGESWTLISSFSFFQSAVWYLGTISFSSFSKFNVGLVWYYYNLWGFNFFIGFVGLGISMTLLINIVFGLIVRLINVIALFLIYPMVVGIAPLDNTKAQGSWRQEFVGNILMCYGAVVGMNLCFMILPFLQTISFFNSRVPDLIFNFIILIAALLSVKRIITVFSQLIGGKDANMEGAETKEESKKIAFAGAEKGMKMAGMGVKVASAVMSGGATLAAEAAKAAAKKKLKKDMLKKLMEKINKKKAEEAEKERKEQEKDEKNENQNTETDKPDDQNNEQDDNTNQNVDSTDNTDTSKPVTTTSKPEKNTENNTPSDDSDELDHVADLAMNVGKNVGEKGFSKNSGMNKKDAQAINKWFNEELKRRQAEKRKEKGSNLNKEENNQLREEVKQAAMEKFMAEEVGRRVAAEMVKEDKQIADEVESEGRAKAEKREAKIKKRESKEGTSYNFLEIASSSLKAIGSITGISTDLAKGLKDAGVVKAFYQNIEDFSSLLHMNMEPLNKKTSEKKEEDRRAEEADLHGKIYHYTGAFAKQLKEIEKLAQKFNIDYKEKNDELDKVKHKNEELSKKKNNKKQ